MKNYNLNNIYAWPLTTRLLIMGLVCSVVFYLGYLWDLSGLKKQLGESQQQEDNLKQQLELILKKRAKLETTLVQLQRSSQIFTIWQGRLINFAKMPELLNEILKLGTVNQLHFTLFDPGVEKKVNDYYMTPIKIIVVGDYHQIAAFISQVSNMRWIVVIGDFIISNENKNDVLGSKLAQEANNDKLLTATIMLEIYHLHEKKT